MGALRIGHALPSEAVRLATLQQRAALAGFRHIFPPAAPPPTVDGLNAEWARWLEPRSSDGFRVFVARVDEEPAGVVLAMPDPAAPDAGHLARLYVDPERWGLGIGGELYAAAVDHLSARRFEQATLWVLEGNTRARNWYERLGWTATTNLRPVYEAGGIFDVQYRFAVGARPERAGYQ
jgi:ribosomal protein S18 acetylase RimI-like enzyme